MTISQLIAKLEEVKTQHGDLNVYVDELDCYGESIGETTDFDVNVTIDEPFYPNGVCLEG